jgi:hypothetical protein
MDENPNRGRADKDLLYEVAYDEAARALSEQLSVIENLRSFRFTCIEAISTIWQD